jgi:hypothetical protein
MLGKIGTLCYTIGVGELATPARVEQGKGQHAAASRRRRHSGQKGVWNFLVFFADNPLKSLNSKK